MKKALMAAAVLLASATAFAQSENYNRVGLSYDLTPLSFSKNLDTKNFSLNGIGVNYVHGFKLLQEKPLFLEVGGQLTYSFHKETTKEEGYEFSDKYTFITLGVPVNVVWKYQINDDIALLPYVGLNFKLHLDGKDKYEAKYMGEKESETINLFNKKDMEDVYGKTFNRFQMGWHIGCGVQYKPYYLGISYGTDFIKAYSNKGAKVSTADFCVNLGYNF